MRVRIVGGFALLVLVLVGVVFASAWLVRAYRNDTAAMQQRADTASLLQTGEAQASVAALLIQRYVTSGDATLIPEIQQDAAQATESLNAAVAAAKNGSEKPEQVAALEGMAAAATGLTDGAQQIIALRQSGAIQQAGAALEVVVPQFRQFRLTLMAAASAELQQVADLQSQAETTGWMALWILIASGVVGVLLAVSVGFVIARSIVSPLSRLEATALAVTNGDMDARAPVTGPRELARLSGVLNLMMNKIHERTEDLRRSNEELKQRNRQLLDARAQAAREPVTGLLNHRKFHETIRDAIASAERMPVDLGLIMLDIDNFKRVNDCLGHQAGDDILRQLASALNEVFGDEAVYRYGGDEFVVLLKGHDHAATADSARQLLEVLRGRLRDPSGHAVGVSLGVSSFPETAASAEELIYRADMALNWAKSMGKDQVGDWNGTLQSKLQEAAPGRTTAAR